MRLESAVLLLLLDSLLLLMLSLLLLLGEPPLLLFDELVESSLPGFAIGLRLEAGEEVIRVFDYQLLNDFRLLLGFLDLAIVYDLLEPLMNGQVSVFLLEKFLRFLVDFRLLSQLFEFPLGAK